MRKVFQDPTGSHLLICMKSKECYYIGQASKRNQPRLLPKVKGQVIESVAWNKMEMKEQSGGTGAILLGTAQGLCSCVFRFSVYLMCVCMYVCVCVCVGIIYETDVLFEDSILKQRKGYFAEVCGRVMSSRECVCMYVRVCLLQLHQLFDVSEHVDPITGLYLEPFPSSSSKCFIMVTTPRR